MVVTFAQSYFFHTLGFLENMKNSLPGGLEIGSQRASSSQGHFPTTEATKHIRTRRATRINRAAISLANTNVKNLSEDWKRKNVEPTGYPRNEWKDGQRKRFSTHQCRSCNVYLSIRIPFSPEYDSLFCREGLDLDTRVITRFLLASSWLYWQSTTPTVSLGSGSN